MKNMHASLPSSPGCIRLLFIGLVALAINVQAEVGKSWRPRSPKPNGEQLSQVITTDTSLIAVGAGTTILQSTDNGAHWTASLLKSGASFYNDTSIAWNGVSGAGSLLLAMAGGDCWKSTDGTSWQTLNHDLPSGSTLHNVIWTGTQWAALRDYYANIPRTDLITSADGQHWVIQGELPNAGSSNGIWWRKLIWNGSAYALVGQFNDFTTGSTVIYLTHSTDGSTWDTTELTDADDASNMFSIAWTGTFFATVGNNYSQGLAYTSPDGITWTRHTLATFPDAVCWDGSQLVAVGYQSVETSPDGDTWTQETPVGSPRGVSDLIWTGTQFVSAGYGGAIFTAPDVTNWTRRTPSGPHEDWMSVGSNGTGLLTAIDFAATPYASTDGGDTWTQGTLGGDSTFSTPTKIAWDGTTFAGAAGEGIWLSTNGTSWTNTAFFPGESMTCVAAGNGKLVAIGGGSSGDGVLYVSSDHGQTWTQANVPAGLNYYLQSVAYIGSLWVVVGNGGTILTSADTVTWTLRSNSGNPIDLISVAGKAGLMVAVSNDPQSRYFTSSNGTTWTIHTNPEFSLRGSAIWTGTNFVVANSSEVYTSPDGTTWTRRSAQSSLYSASLIWDGSQAVLAGNNGIVLTSDTVPEAQFVSAQATVSESVGTFPVQVELTNPSASTLSVPITLGGTAAVNTDFTYSPTSVTFNPGELSKTINVAITNDASVEADETATFQLGAVAGMRVGTPGKFTLVIADNDGPPPMRFTKTSATAFEGQETVGVRVELAWPAPAAATVSITTGGTADANDYAAIPSQLNFAIGESTKFIPINIAADAVTEADETLTLTLSSPTGAVLGSSTTFNLTIKDPGPATDAGNRWVLQQSKPAAGYYSSIATNGNRSVIVGDKGMAISSEDGGLTWTQRFTGSDAVYNRVIAYGTGFLAVGDEGHVMQSPDGILWSESVIPGPQRVNLLGCFADGTRAMVCGYHYDSTANAQKPLLFTSSDLVNWQPVTLPSTATGEAEAIAWSGTNFVLVGGEYVYNYTTQTSAEAPLVLTSSDGFVWTHRTGAAIPSAFFENVIWAGNKFIAFNDSTKTFTSTDGAAWTTNASGAKGLFTGISTGGNTALAVGGAVAASSNGTTWPQTASPSKNWLLDVTKNGSTYIAISAAGGIFTSANGTVWSRASSGLETYGTLFDAVWSGTKYVAVGGSYFGDEPPLLLTSDTGTTWTPQSYSKKTTMLSVVWTGTQFAAVGSGGSIATSPDGKAWTARTSGVTQDLHQIIWTGSQFVAVGGNETNEDERITKAGSVVLSSPNGIAWTRRTVPSIRSLEGVIFTGNLYIAVGRATFDGGIGNAEILTSTDSINWTHQQSNLYGRDLHRVAWNGLTFAATGDENSFVYSSDGITWTVSDPVPAPSLFDSNPVGICWTGTQFVAVGNYGEAFTSSDGIAWSMTQTDTKNRLFGLDWNGSRIVAVGDYATIQTSTPTSSAPTNFVSFDQPGSTVSEADGVANIRVSLTLPPTTAITLPYTVTAGASLVLSGTGADVTMPTVPSLVFNPGETSKYISIKLINDTLDESTEDLTLTLGTPSAGVSLAPINTSYVLHITDNDTEPTISITTGVDQFLPSGNPASPLFLAVTATGSPPLTFQWKLNGKAIAKATSPTYYLPTVTTANGGTYTCTVSNAVKKDVLSSAVEIGVIESVNRPLAITGTVDTTLTQPASANVDFFWFKDGSPTPFVAALPDSEYSATRNFLKLKKVPTFTLTGTYVCKPKLKLKSSVEGTGNSFVITQVTGVPVLDPITLPHGVVGVPYTPTTLTPSASSPTITTWSAAPLPIGLKLNPLTGVISGSPTTAGTKTVTIFATNGKGVSNKITTNLIIDAIAADTIGTLTGLVDRDPVVNNNLGGLISITITKDGLFSGSYTFGTAKQPFKGQARAISSTFTGGDASFTVNGKLVNVTFDYDASLPSARGTGAVTIGNPPLLGPASPKAAFKLWRPHTTPADFAGRYNFSIRYHTDPLPTDNVPLGIGYGSATLSSSGAVAWAGRAGDGSSFTASSFIGYDGTASLYAAPNGPLGSLMSQASISLASPLEDSLIGDANASWSKLPDTSIKGARNYPAGWAPTTMDIQGCRYTYTTGDVVMGMSYTPFTPNATLLFFDAGIDNIAPSAFLPNVQVNIKPTGATETIYSNRATTLKVTNTTGEFGGAFDMNDPMPNGIVMKRHVLYFGQIVRTPGGSPEFEGVGVFTMEQLPSATISPMPLPTTTPKLAGSVELSPF